MFSNTTGRAGTASGYESLYSNTYGEGNTASGYQSLYSNQTGDYNTAIGLWALHDNTAGHFNIALGAGAGINTTGSNNIDIGSDGSPGESNTIRIGDPTFQDRTFVAGIYGTPVTGWDVNVTAEGQLGYLSSSRRTKHDIMDMGHESDVLMQLRPVAFYYRPEIDPDQVRQYGLIAEEVVEVAPNLVLNSPTGEPESVRYDSVNAMLLNEVQKQRREIEELRRMVQILMDERVGVEDREAANQ